MEEDIKILEEQLNTYKRHIENYQKEECLTRVYYELKSYATALENLIKGYKIEKLRNTLDEQSLKEALDDYIPKSNVQEKIEELKENTCIYCGGECVKINGFYWEVGGIITTLQELMEDK